MENSGQFKPGQSGNPRGKPKGTRSWTSKFRDQLAESVPDVLESLIQQAKEGDTAAAKLILDRVLPSLKPAEQSIKLPLEGTPAEQAQQVIAALAGGKLAVGEASAVLSSLTSLAKIEEFTELEQRIAALEARQ